MSRQGCSCKLAGSCCDAVLSRVIVATGTSFSGLRLALQSAVSCCESTAPSAAGSAEAALPSSVLGQLQRQPVCRCHCHLANHEPCCGSSRVVIIDPRGCPVPTSTPQAAMLAGRYHHNLACRPTHPYSPSIPSVSTREFLRASSFGQPIIAVVRPWPWPCPLFRSARLGGPSVSRQPSSCCCSPAIIVPTVNFFVS